MTELKKSTYLVVEDEENKRDFLVRFLIDIVDNDELIFDTDNSLKAIDLIQDYEPDIVLLDIKIPRDPVKHTEPMEINCLDVIRQIKIHNQENTKKIKVIIVSATVENLGFQKLIGEDHKVVHSFIDKNEISINPDSFKVKLRNHIEQALREDIISERIDYKYFQRSAIKALEKLNPQLWERINKSILDEFEKFSIKDVDERTIADNIIKNCGKVVEDIVNILEDDSLVLSEAKYKDISSSMQSKLTALSGRQYNRNKTYEITEDPIISRKAAEYGTRAYIYRNEASHSHEGDLKNNKMFVDSDFSKEDAAISVQLIFPLIKDYINHLTQTK